LNIFVPGGTVPRALRLPLSVVLLACVSDWACGADTPFAAPSAQGAISPTGGTLRVTVAMILVLGAVLAAAWLARRLRGMSGALGTRERAVLIRVGERQVLIGVAPGSVRMLHLVEASASGSAASGSSASGSSALSVADGPPRPSFKALLLKSLGK
jgi:flagellar protein FliO/FliZ